MVSGFWPTVLLGVGGGAISEAIRIAGALRANNPPTRNQLIASLIFTLLGAGVLLYGWDEEQAVMKVAMLGAAFPLLFTAGVAAASGPKRSGGEGSTSLSRYLSYRFAPGS